MGDAAALARSDELFCACEAGQALQRAVQKRYDDTLADFNAASALSAEKRALQASRSAGQAGIPLRFVNATLEALAAAVTLKNEQGQPLLDDTGSPVIEPAKYPGLGAAFALRNTGLIPGQEKRSLLLWSQPPGGTGKTTCVTGIYNHWRSQGRTGVWTTLQQLLLEIRAGYDDHTANARILQVQAAEVLVLDDLGEYNRAAVTANTMEILSWIIYERHAWDRPTLFTSNWKPDQMAERLTPQIWHRIREMAAVVEFAGTQLRRA